VETQVRSMLGLSPGAHAPVMRVSAKTGQGLEELWKGLVNTALRGRPSHLESGEALLHLAQARLAEWFAAAQAEGDPKLQGLIAQWRQEQIGTDEAVVALLQLLQRERGFLREKLPH